MSSMANGFIAVPFKLPTHPKVHLDSNHYLYVKKHQPKDPKEQNCLFCVNLPMLTNIEVLKTIVRQLCDKYDTVAHIEELMYNNEFGLDDINLSSLTSDLLRSQIICSTESRFTPKNTSLLRFVDSCSVDNIWNALNKYSKDIKNSDLLIWELNNPGIDTFIKFYKPVDLNYLKEDVYSHLQYFNQFEQAAQDEVQSSIVDEDGFTLVVGKNTKSLDSIKKKILKKNPLSKYDDKPKGKTMVDKKSKEDFYRFQIREKKKIEINQLLTKFKEDQEKIKVMKQKKRFNPYTNSI